MNSEGRKIKEWLFNKLHITRKPVIKVYNGYGDQDLLLVYGHVLRQSPLPKKKFKKNFWSNSMSLLRLFMVEPYPRAKLQMNWKDVLLEVQSDKDGFFKFEWQSPKEPEPGWHPIKVELASSRHRGIYGEGKVLVPFPTQYGFISDIDDTFLISYSRNLRKRLYVLFTKNARTRKPFEGVVRHYQLLANTDTTLDNPNPFFYVSSSEWNLYDYINEFNRSYGMPEGVYLLSQMKKWYELLRSGQTKHNGKFVRIARVLKEFPHKKFILLGDDTQKDAEIYARIAQGFKDRILCVYLRQVGKSRKPHAEFFIKEMRTYGVEVCYFKKSEEAIAHSQRTGLIEKL
jgi:phosphatidate phosphatase APP1